MQGIILKKNRKEMAECAHTEHMGMNTVMSHRVFGAGAEEALGAARDETARLERLYSRYIPDSDIGRINLNAGIRPQRISGETYAMLKRALEFSKCGGVYDITAGPLVDLWRGGRAAGKCPVEDTIRRALILVNHADLILDPREGTAMLRRRGQSVDPGGIGKGYAADRVLAVFKRYGISSAFTNLGGNVAALGGKTDGSPWRVGIRHPRREGRLIGAVAIADKAVVTSGDDQRFFIDGAGRRRHHILDTATGYPADAGLASVTVIAHRATDADALSTILFIAGLEKGMALLEGFPGAEAVFVDAGMRVYVTPGLRGCFQADAGVDIQILNGKESEKNETKGEKGNVDRTGDRGCGHSGSGRGIFSGHGGPARDQGDAHRGHGFPWTEGRRLCGRIQ